MKGPKRLMADLTPEMVRTLVSYDPATGAITRNLPGPGALPAGRRCDVRLNHGYRQVSIANCTCRAHRVAWLLAYGAWPQHEVDHINGDRSDNRLANLRDVPKYVNGHNRGPSRTSRSGIKGVYETKAGTWMATIQVRTRRYGLGTYPTKDQAAAAYAAASRTHLRA